MSVHTPVSPPINRTGAWVEQLILNVSDNLAFAFFSGVAGYMSGRLVLPVTHAIAGYIADGLGVEYSFPAQVWVYHLTIWGTALFFAYLGVAFALITKRRPEPDEAELEPETQAWGESLEHKSQEEPAYRLTRRHR